MANLDEAAVIRRISEDLDGVDTAVANGDTFFFYNPGNGAPADNRFPFATLVTGDDYDQVSNLSRPGVFRLNLGISGDTFRRLFGAPPPPPKEGVTPTGYDWAALDQLMPHPTYGNMFWVCILNPSSWSTIQPLVQEAHEMAAGRLARRAVPGVD